MSSSSKGSKPKKLKASDMVKILHEICQVELNPKTKEDVDLVRNALRLCKEYGTTPEKLAYKVEGVRFGDESIEIDDPTLWSKVERQLKKEHEKASRKRQRTPSQVQYSSARSPPPSSTGSVATPMAESPLAPPTSRSRLSLVQSPAVSPAGVSDASQEAAMALPGVGTSRDTTLPVGLIGPTWAQPFRYMDDSHNDRSDMVASRVATVRDAYESEHLEYQRLQKKLAVLGKSEGGQASGRKPELVMGRVVCLRTEGAFDLRLSEHTVGLELGDAVLRVGDFEECDELSSDQMRIRLRLGSVPRYSLFPGQIVAIQGVRSTDTAMVVQRVLLPPALPKRVNDGLRSSLSAQARQLEKSMKDKPLTVLSAAGPFGLQDEQGGPLDWGPLASVIERAQRVKPDVLVLQGPFMPAGSALDSQTLLRVGADKGIDDLTSDEELLCDLMCDVLRGVLPLRCRVVVQPSTRDRFSPPVIPQPAYSFSKDGTARLQQVLTACSSQIAEGEESLGPVESNGFGGDNQSAQSYLGGWLLCVPNPCVLNVNGVVMALGTHDPIYSLAGSEFVTLKMRAAAQRQAAALRRSRKLPKTEEKQVAAAEKNNQATPSEPNAMTDEPTPTVKEEPGSSAVVKTEPSSSNVERKSPASPAARLMTGKSPPRLEWEINRHTRIMRQLLHQRHLMPVFPNTGRNAPSVAARFASHLELQYSPDLMILPTNMPMSSRVTPLTHEDCVVVTPRWGQQCAVISVRSEIAADDPDKLDSICARVRASVLSL